MNKTEMIEAVASETGLAKTEVAKVLNAYTAEIIKAVAAGGDYTVIGFGKFYASQRLDAILPLGPKSRSLQPWYRNLQQGKLLKMRLTLPRNLLAKPVQKRRNSLIF